MSARTAIGRWIVGLIEPPVPHRRVGLVDPELAIPADKVSLIEQLQAETRRKTIDIPPDKTTVIVTAVDWKAGVPSFRFGTATRVGKNFELTAEAQTNFSKASTSASVHAVWSF